MYLASNTRPDIAVNLLTKYNSSPTKRFWNGIKHILCYLWGTIDISFFYSNKSNFDLVGFVNYLSESYKTRSQTCYLFTC